MITDRSITEVRDRADIVSIVKRYVPDLKKKGTNHTGCCPFHDEKTGSFHVNPVKEIYKCFGCGEGGDAIKFVMRKENIDFISAIKAIAEWFNVTLEETEQPEEEKKNTEARTRMIHINEAVAKRYRDHLLDMRESYAPALTAPLFELLNIRKLSMETIIDFQIGYAPDEWRFIAPGLVNIGLFQLANQLGLVGSTNGTNYDMYKNRIMFPIHNEQGVVVGFGGRLLEVKGEGKKEDKQAKYLNSKDSPLYNKERVLYGLYQAAKAIREMKFAILVEGYYDVIGFHQGGLPNTVAPCGTALTEGQCKILKRYTNHIVLVGDGDAAGMKANLKNVDLLLRNGFKVEICPLPEKEDPDSFARALFNPEPVGSLDEPYSLVDEEEMEVA